jgi:hypothetical protein
MLTLQSKDIRTLPPLTIDLSKRFSNARSRGRTRTAGAPWGESSWGRYSEAQADFERALRDSILVPNSPTQVVPAILRCDFIETPFTKLQLLRTRFDQGEAEFNARLKSNSGSSLNSVGRPRSSIIIYRLGRGISLLISFPPRVFCLIREFISHKTRLKERGETTGSTSQ